MGFVRLRVLAHYTGSLVTADIVAGVLRGGNQLQNLLGEQALSASFVPLYSRMVEEGKTEDARRFAGAALGLLTFLASCGVLLGVALAPVLVSVSFPGFLLADPEAYRLAVAGVRYVFPMAGVLVVSAWCLAILNSHRRFLLPYLAPVTWNLAIIAVLVASLGLGVARSEVVDPRPVVLAVCWGALLGSVLQLGVQLPTTLRLLGGVRLSLSRRVTGIAEAVSRFGPAVLGRGSVQLSAWADYALASFLASGAMASLERAQRLYLLPIALFATAVAVVELTELSRESDPAREDAMGERLRLASRRSSFLLAPTVVGYLAFGLPLVGAIFETGRFGRADAWLVYLVLGAYALGMLPAAASRLVQNGFFVFGDTRTPARLAFVKVGTAIALGAGAMLLLDRVSVQALAPTTAGSDGLFLGAVGLALGSAVANWLETLWLGRALRTRHGVRSVEWRAVSGHVVRAALSAAPWLAAWTVLRGQVPPFVEAAVLVPGFAATYLLGSVALRVPDARDAWQAVRRRLGGRGRA